MVARSFDASVSTVVVVDDDPILLQVFREVLQARMPESRIISCASSEQALAQVAAADVDVLVTDLVLPRVSGFELMQRARELRPNLLAILVTGADDRQLSLKALRLGAYDFIQKPVDGDDLVASVRRAVDTRRLRREVERQHETLRRHAEDLEKSVEARTRELLVAHRLKDEFLATISHELRTPLTAILGWSRLLSRPQVDDATRTQGVLAIARNAKAQANLIDDLLDVSRIITGKMRLEVRPVSIDALLERAVAAVLPAAQAKGITIDPAMDSGLGELAGDSQRLTQVLWNILSNAVKFTPSGGKIRIEAHGGGAFVEIAVSDTGCGIRADLLPHVFDRLRQGDEDTGSRRGLGLGLAIVRHLVELHGGTVSAVSGGSGAGSKITVCLPRRAESSPDPSPARPPMSSDGAPEANDEHCLEGLSVLVIDDEPDAREVVGVTLRRAGARIVEAGNAAEALEVLQAQRPDVLLCDIGLPDASGHVLIGRVRHLDDATLSAVPAIAFTAYARPEDRDMALASGFQLHLAKPGPPDLPGVIARVIGAH